MSPRATVLRLFLILPVLAGALLASVPAQAAERVAEYRTPLHITDDGDVHLDDFLLSGFALRDKATGRIISTITNPTMVVKDAVIYTDAAGATRVSGGDRLVGPRGRDTQFSVDLPLPITTASGVIVDQHERPENRFSLVALPR